jgi:hypothetical protein
MPSHYSVVRFVPDVVAEECVNIGIIVVDDRGADCHFVASWTRAANFGKTNAAFLREIAASVESACNGLFDDEAEMPIRGLAALERISAEWANTIQVTPPRGSLRERHELLHVCTRQFLGSSLPKERSKHKTRATAITVGKRALRGALEEVQLDGTFIVVDRDLAVIRGDRVDQHHFDFGVKNGVVRAGGFGLSFDRIDSEALQGAIDRIALAIWDVRRVDTSVPLGVVAVGDVRSHMEAWVRADALFGNSAADLIKEGQADEWSQEVVHVLAGKQA